MKKQWMVLPAAWLMAAQLSAWGISPERAENSQAVSQTENGQSVLQPAPQPSNLLGPGAQNPAQPQAPTVDDNIRNYVPDEWAKDWGHIHLDEAIALHKDKQVVFVDARAKAEYDQGHIPGAIPMPLGEFDTYFAQYQAKLKRAKRIVTYCHGAGCKLSDKVAQKLYVDKKFRNVASFFGGWPQWQEHNLPIETGPGPKGN